MNSQVPRSTSKNPQSAIRNPKFIAMLGSLLFILCALLFALCPSAKAQQPAKIPRIGYLAPFISTNASLVEAFRQGLHELRYDEGKNIVIEWRSWEGKPERQRVLAAELVRLKVDVIVAMGSGEIRAARQETATIPIVMVRGSDPVGSGFVASLARPGGNITGLAILRPDGIGYPSAGAKRKASRAVD